MPSFVMPSCPECASRRVVVGPFYDREACRCWDCGKAFRGDVTGFDTFPSAAVVGPSNGLASVETATDAGESVPATTERVA